MSNTPTYQYFYKVDSCKAMSSKSSDCICWHDEFTGPHKADRSLEIFKSLHWRLKPKLPQALNNDAVDFLNPKSIEQIRESLNEVISELRSVNSKLDALLKEGTEK